ncbi:UPF0109 protein [Endomicrobiia bacterium]|nr:UPF0109 protein [Endomicrobiia bacterium]GHT64315.1 UPF0109 protein [Endomicrobiia bacterium]GHT69176.1 UPF0109 protein [Endomicrobiia bacterium]GHT73189.1 UPF0109 protein [Endomicrobiia bacterium]
MKDLVLLMAKALVDNPEQVEVREVAGERTTVLEIKVVVADRGKIIGKEGRIIKAIRVIVSSASAKLNKRTTVEVVE